MYEDGIDGAFYKIDHPQSTPTLFHLIFKGKNFLASSEPYHSKIFDLYYQILFLSI